MYENETLIKLLKEIANDEIIDEYGRRLVRHAIRCTAKFMLFETLKGNSIAKSANEIEKMFPEEYEKIIQKEETT